MTLRNATIDRLKAASSKEEGRKIGMEFTLKLCEKLRAAGAPGIHVFVMSDENAAAELLNNFKQ